MNLSKKAFTLVELLVVIAIIGLIATLSVIALSNARAKSRDVKRVADIKQIQSALELFFNDENRYPTVAEWNTGSLYSTTSFSTTTYISDIPVAPTNSDGTLCSDDSLYSYSSSGDRYTLSTCLGNNSGSLSPGIIIANEESVANCGEATAIDADGNRYNTVQIGTQCWLTKNINVGTRIDTCSSGPCSGDCSLSCTARGSSINEQLDGGQELIQKYCYNDDPAFCDSEGGLYQWHMALGLSQTCKSHDTSTPCVEVDNMQGVCPIGWHIPSDAEWSTLSSYLGGELAAGDALKEAGSTNWGVDNNADNSSGFTGLPGGRRFVGGDFSTITGYAFYWTATAYSNDTTWYRYLKYNNSGIGRDEGSKARGFFVRCLKD